MAKILAPLDVLKQAFLFVSGRIRHGEGGKPGEVVSHLPEESRKILQDLKSSDISDAVIPEWEAKGWVTPASSEFNKDLENFDKKILKNHESRPKRY